MNYLLPSDGGIETNPHAKVSWKYRCWDGLGSPFGFETTATAPDPGKGLAVGMAWEARSGLKLTIRIDLVIGFDGWDGLGSPLGFETHHPTYTSLWIQALGWPGKPVGV